MRQRHSERERHGEKRKKRREEKEKKHWKKEYGCGNKTQNWKENRLNLGINKQHILILILILILIRIECLTTQHNHNRKYLQKLCKVWCIQWCRHCLFFFIIFNFVAEPTQSCHWTAYQPEFKMLYQFRSNQSLQPAPPAHIHEHMNRTHNMQI